MTTASTSADNAIQPFRVAVAEEMLDDLRQRITAVRLPHKESAEVALGRYSNDVPVAGCNPRRVSV